MAFRDFVGQIGCKTNLICIDELFDGADKEFTRRAFGIMDGSVYVISHRDGVEELVDDVLLVEMKGGFSRIKT